jgi:hypothetical protein
MALVHEAEQIIDLLPAGSRVGPLARVARVYTALGEVEQAERTAGAAGVLADADPTVRVESLVEIARTYVQLGWTDQAAHTLRRAERLVGKAYRGWQSYEEALLAGALAAVGSAKKAQRRARSITDPDERVRGLLLVAKARPQGAARLVDQAERVARSITEAAPALRALTWVAEAMARQRRYEDAWRVSAEAERIAADAEPDRRPGAYAQVAIAFARADQAGRAIRLALLAEELATAVANRDARMGALVQVVEAYARAGDLALAERHALALADHFHRASALSRLVQALVDAGDLDRAAAHARGIDSAQSLWRLGSLLDVAEAAQRP